MRNFIVMVTGDILQGLTKKFIGGSRYLDGMELNEVYFSM